MITEEISQRVRLLEIRTRQSIASGFAGKYRSAFKGRGLEFDAVREYAAGDDIRDIDWNVSARTGRLFVKRYVEERQLKVMLALDISASVGFGALARSKRELASEFCALVAFSAIRNSDHVGVLLFTDRIEKFIPPAKGSLHATRLLYEVLNCQPAGRGTGIAGALGYLARVMHRRCVVFLVSDFLGDGFDQPMRIVARRHDLIAVRTFDPRERALPDAGLLALRDPETGARLVVDSSDPETRAAYAQGWAERDERLADAFRSAQIDHISIATDKECFGALVSFFRARENRY